MEFEQIYDDVQVTTGLHSSGDDNQSSTQYVYQDPVLNPRAPEYTNLSGIQSKRGRNVDELHRSGYKSLVVRSGEDDTNEYDIAIRSGIFSSNEITSMQSSNELACKPSTPPVSKRHVSQKKNALINGPPAKEDWEVKGCQKEAPKRNFKIVFLYCVVVFSIVISLAALAVAISSIVWGTLQMAQYRNLANCLMELLLRNESFSGEHFKNATHSACVPFQLTN